LHLPRVVSRKITKKKIRTTTKEMKQQPEYQVNKIWPMIKVACRIVQNEPDILNDEARFKAQLALSLPTLKDKMKCPGCDRSMKITVYEADLHDALLILAMAREVRENIRKGIKFTEANKVHIPTLQATNATIKRQTKCDYLGLVKQPENWRGSGYWLLTRWAWKALRGEAIPKSTKYWEGNLLGRSEATTTLSEMFKKHKDLVQLAIAKKKAIKADYRAKFEDYNPKDWTDFEDTPTQGELV
jgi:hypothetical protein